MNEQAPWGWAVTIEVRLNLTGEQISRLHDWMQPVGGSVVSYGEGLSRVHAHAAPEMHESPFAALTAISYRLATWLHMEDEEVRYLRVEVEPDISEAEAEAWVKARLPGLA
jgi:hypothetical protein